MKTHLLPFVTASALCLLLVSCASTEETVVPPRPAADNPSFTAVTNCRVLNSEEDDFAPWVSRDGKHAIVTSNRRLAAADRKFSPEFLYGEKLLVTERTAAGTGENTGLGLHRTERWTPLSPLQEGAFSVVNTGTAMFDDGTVTYFSTTYAAGGRGGADIWLHGPSGATPVDGINSSWWDAQPALSPDGMMLVFASDRVSRDPSVSDTGRRTPHLYYAIKSGEGAWSDPQPLPAPVNSSSAEISPWFDSDGTLYFATARRGSFDIATTRLLSDNIWSEPSFFKEPINTAANDCFAVLSPDRTEMLFASDREGGLGGYDIWSADRPTCVRFEGAVRLVSIGKKGDTIVAPGSNIRMTVKDDATGRVLDVGSTDARGVYTASSCLRPKTAVTVSSESMNCFTTGNDLHLKVPVPTGTEDMLRGTITLVRQPLPVFEPKNDSIPFFVTGYWYPNTTTNLDRMLSEWPKGRLRNANYIEPDSFNYRQSAVVVEQWFEKLYGDIESMLLPMLDTCYANNDTLVLHVYGYVDPRGLAWGLYEDEATARTAEMTIEPGTVMQQQDGNKKLANLRGYYSMMMIDRDMMSRSSRYTDLRKQNRVQLRAHGEYIGFGKDGTQGGPLDDPYKRKFLVRVTLHEGK
ncbi:MAG: PD40 domain-containing protein [Ignavibacteriae bacterium]|nr:PD40 domain-containing protein [Ignavibacteriota bacterium]